MIKDHQQADEQLADALWWLRGFAAAQPADDRATPLHMADSLREVRVWLRRLSEGLTRLIGTDDRSFAIALTEAEFEQLWDAARAPDDESGAAERRETVERLRPILTKFTEERRAFADARTKELPF